MFGCHVGTSSTRHNGGVAPRSNSPVTRAKERTRDVTRSVVRPTPEDAQFKHVVAKWAIRFVGGAFAIAAILSFVVIPVRDFRAQSKALDAKTVEFEALADINEQLQIEVSELSTPEGIRNAARTLLGYVLPGEQRLTLTQMPSLPTDLPQTWPYTMVSDIVQVRTEVAQASDNALSPLGP
jgi:cell division protein FtsB